MKKQSKTQKQIYVQLKYSTEFIEFCSWIGSFSSNLKTSKIFWLIYWHGRLVPWNLNWISRKTSSDNWLQIFQISVHGLKIHSWIWWSDAHPEDLGTGVRKGRVDEALGDDGTCHYAKYFSVLMINIFQVDGTPTFLTQSNNNNSELTGQIRKKSRTDLQSLGGEMFRKTLHNPS